MQVLTDLLCKPWLNGIGVLVGFLGFFLWYIAYKSSKLEAKLSYQSKTLKLIDKDKKILPSDIKILFKEKEIPRLAKTFIIIWNSGNKTILGENIVKNDKPRIIFEKDADILNATIVKKTREVTGCKIEQNKDALNEIIIDFDYLDIKDGISIEILHTDKKDNPRLKGSIKEIPKGMQNYGSIRIRKDKGYWIFQIISVFLLLIGIYTMAFPNIAPMWLWGKEGIPSLSSRLLLIVICLFMLGLMGYDLWSIKRAFPRNLSIDELF